MGLFDFSAEELHEIWNIEDKYFQFNYGEYNTFGARLKKWRELAGYTQREVAEYLYDSYKELGKKTSKLDSIQRKYLSWESNDQNINDVILSMTDFFLLRRLIGCDYEFLFCEINTLHKDTDMLSDLTGLNATSIETLLAFEDFKLYESNSDISMYAITKQLILSLIATDEKLLLYLSNFLTNANEDNKNQIVKIDIPQRKKYELDISSKELKYDDLMDIHLFTIVNLLGKLKDSLSEKEMSFNENNVITEDTLCPANSPLGIRLKAWRDLRGVTQRETAEMLCDAAKKLHNEHPAFDSIMRTYQNWESRKTTEKEIRIHIGDLKLLKHIMECDYAYLLGNIDCLYIPFSNPQTFTGLTNEAIDSIKKYSHPGEKDPAYYYNYIKTLDMIISDDELLSELACYLIGTRQSVDYGDNDLLKPTAMTAFISPLQADMDYFTHLYTNSDESNILLPLICKRLLMHRNETKRINDIIEKHNIDTGIF